VYFTLNSFASLIEQTDKTMRITICFERRKHKTRLDVQIRCQRPPYAFPFNSASFLTIEIDRFLVIFMFDKSYEEQAPRDFY